MEAIIANYKGEDPIENWLKYYKWAQENYPSDTKRILTILDRVTREFTQTRQYRNDIRYLKLWVIYVRYYIISFHK